jgi:hypothetical protein
MFVRVSAREIMLVMHIRISTPRNICNTNLRVLGIYLLFTLLEYCEKLDIIEVEDVELAED